MKRGTTCLAVALFITSCLADAQQPVWQQKLEESQRAAADGRAEGFVLGSGPKVDAEWVPGVHAYYNNPRPFCYKFVIPGDWNGVRGQPGLYRSPDGRASASVTFLPPQRLEGIEGGTLVERARNYAVRQLERNFRQPLAGIELVPFESARPGTWQLKAAPIVVLGGRTAPFPIYIIVELSPQTVAEINVFGTGDDTLLARRIIESLRTSAEHGCYLADVERLYKYIYGER